ncbi:N-acetylmuramoyl-L-alanine amidase [Gemelliphila palaticanis]|uniref:N-acetylmuramoyl-L-alanine amidase n=1 Tax=Gemelliphila palaticanis TaxID=81950 RepID=A0ABX2T1R1_9BACL|nr:N-acetylmuramoyl-L-alanine amidase [Gemella palaticanis]MBF0715210.1 N-acetylmuramoyl-L-alanine amidase [Gemella palaticanis]NYS47140.1 N-acetylmuramoyl-L-alanine amidase [Gemella palaticanis]
MRIKRRRKLDVMTLFVISIIFLLLLSTVIYYNYNEKIIGRVAENKIIITSKDSIIRTGPDELFPIVHNIPPGEELKKLSEIGEWIEVKTNNNIVGWIAGWDIVGSNIKSPEEKFRESLNKFTVLINPKITEGATDYSLDYALALKEELNKLNITVVISRDGDKNTDENTISNLISDNKVDIVLNIDLLNGENKGPGLYYETYSSQILSKYVEKSLSNNYIMKTRASEKSSLAIPINNNIPEILLILGNMDNPVDISIIDKNIYKDEYINALKNGIENYFYYLLRIEDQNNKRRESLLNMPQKGLNVPFYYMKQEEFKNISYGNDNNKKISDNGDLIISMAMITNYIDPTSKITVTNIVDWAGLNYYKYGVGTSELIIPAFAEKNNYKLDTVTSDYLKKIDDALKNNKPVLVKFKSGGAFGKKPSYKVIRGLEDSKYYINDPDDDDLKLNNYTGFNSSDIEKNIVKAWILSK